jgi:hypothetical protein
MKKTVFVIDHGGGFILNFECTKEELKNVLVIPKHAHVLVMFLCRHTCALRECQKRQQRKLAELMRSLMFETKTTKVWNVLRVCVCATPKFIFCKDSHKKSEPRLRCGPCVDCSLGCPHVNAEDISISDHEFVNDGGGHCFDARKEIHGAMTLESDYPLTNDVLVECLRLKDCCLGKKDADWDQANNRTDCQKPFSRIC